MNLKNKVYRVKEPGVIDYIEREVRDLGEDEVLISVKASAICGSDLHIYKGKHPSVTLPATIGHEFSGVIEKKGSKVNNFNIGDRVTLEPCIVCGECDACRHGEYSFCENISFTYRNGDGAMANYVVAKAKHTFKLPNDLSFEEGSLIEPMSVAMHAVRRANVKIGEKVLIIGAGAIGLLICAICHICGAGEIIVVDYVKKRLEVAKEYGATHTCCPLEDNLEAIIKDTTNGKGVDKSFECVGRESTFNQALDYLKKNGLATIVGIFEEPNIKVDASKFITKEIKVQGSQSYCWDFPISIMFADKINLKKLITHEFKLADLNKAFDTCFDKESGAIKVILKP